MINPLNVKNLALQFKQGNPAKRPFVFVHGNTQNDTCGKGIMDYFYQKGHSVLSYDLPGHGDSPLLTKHYQFTHLVDLNCQILQKYQIHSPILCGHSLGAMIQSGTVAQLQLDNASLILCGGLDGNPITTAIKQNQLELASTIEKSLALYLQEGAKLFKSQGKFDYFANRHLDESMVSIINLRKTQPHASATNLNTLNDFDARPELIKLNTPVLVLHGENETVIPKAIIEKMLKDYKNMQIQWYPSGGHCAFYQNHELTIDYLDKHYRFINNSL